MKHLILLEDFNTEQPQVPKLYWGVPHGEDWDHGGIGLILCPYENGIPKFGTWGAPEPDDDAFDDTECDHLREFDENGDPLDEQSAEWEECNNAAYDGFLESYYDSQEDPEIKKYIYLISTDCSYEKQTTSDYENEGYIYNKKWYDPYPIVDFWLTEMRNDENIKAIEPIFDEYESNKPKDGVDSTSAIVNFIIVGVNEGSLIEYVPIINILRSHNIPIDKLLQDKGMDKIKMVKLSKAAKLLKRK